MMNFNEFQENVAETMKQRVGNAEVKIQKTMKNNDVQMFNDSMFTNYFDDAAQDGFAEAQQSYTSLFEDPAKYMAVKSALADIIYKELTRQNKDVN